MRYLLIATGVLLISCGAFKDKQTHSSTWVNKDRLLWFSISESQTAQHHDSTVIRMELRNVSDYVLCVEDAAVYGFNMWSDVWKLGAGEVSHSVLVNFEDADDMRERIGPGEAVNWALEGLSPIYILSPGKYRMQVKYWGKVYDTLGNQLTTDDELLSNTVEFEIQ